VAEFTPAVQYVLANEGGLVNDPADPGGLTNFGISQASYPHLDIRNLTIEEAIAIYLRDFWKFGAFTSQRVATKMLDIYVDLPPAPAIRLLQQALAFLQAGPIVCDGILGPQTIEHVNAADEESLLDELKARLVKYYLGLDRAADEMGWLRRAVKG
jgi:lysozyme family protein